MVIKDLISKTPANSIKCSDMKIDVLFADSNIFLVKEFQRKYEWKELQINELFNEIKDNNNIDYYLGTIILKKESLEQNKNKINLVDGQQRITTLFLLLKSIELKLKEFNLDQEDKEWIKKIRNIYIDDDLERIKIDRLRGQEELRDILINDEYNNLNTDDINKKIHTIQNPIYAFWFKTIQSKISDYDKKEIIKLVEKIWKIRFSVVVLGPKINEYKVFEDLNSKGVDLKIDDLLRNFYAKKISGFDSKNIQKQVNSYEILIHNVEKFLHKEKKQHRSFYSEQISRWFKNYILYVINYKNSISDRNDKRMYLLYKKAINNKLETLEDTLNEINQIKNYLEFCEWINRIDTNEKYLVNNIDYYPLIFSFYKIFKNDEIKMEVIVKVIVLIYFYFCSSQVSIKNFLKKNLEKIKNEIILNHISFKEKINFIFNLIFKDSELDFVNHLKEITKQIINKDFPFNNVISNSNRIFLNFLNAKIEEIKYDNDIDLWSGFYNVEHIIPQNPFFKESDSKYFTLWVKNVNKIGNIFLLEKSLNEEMANHTFEKKKEIFNEYGSEIESTKNIFLNKKFDQEIIDKRNEEILKLIIEMIDIYAKEIDY